MVKSIYVGNLPFSTNDQELGDLFSPYGEVKSVKLINDRDTGRFRGFGFVEMDDMDSANAIQALNGTDMGGRSLRINLAEEKPQRPTKRY